MKRYIAAQTRQNIDRPEMGKITIFDLDLLGDLDQFSIDLDL